MLKWFDSENIRVHVHGSIKLDTRIDERGWPWATWKVEPHASTSHIIPIEAPLHRTPAKTSASQKIPPYTGAYPSADSTSGRAIAVFHPRLCVTMILYVFNEVWLRNCFSTGGALTHSL